MYDERAGIPSDFWDVVNKVEAQKERQMPLHLYSEELLEYILEKLHAAEQEYGGLDVTRDW